MEFVSVSEVELATQREQRSLAEVHGALSHALDLTEVQLAGHSSRVARYTEDIAARLRFSSERNRWLRRAALLHDVGKLGVGNCILDKPDGDEWRQVRMHAQYSEEILQRFGPFQELARIAGAHRERLDGKGYSRGIGGSDILMETRIIIVADIFDAITADRPYRGPVPIDKALQMMEKSRGSAIDSDCLDALCDCVPELEA